MRILGLDPGTVNIGYGVIEGEPPTVVAYGIIFAPAHLPLELRLVKLYDGLEKILTQYQPQEAALEEPFVAKKRDTALSIGRAQGIAILAVSRRKIPVYRYSPPEVKRQVANYGGSSKEQIQEMVRLQLGLKTTPHPSDAADALAVALCHLYKARFAQILSQG